MDHQTLKFARLRLEPTDDKKSFDLTYSDIEFRELLGLGPEAFPNKIIDFKMLLHPDDRDIVGELLQEPSAYDEQTVSLRFLSLDGAKVHIFKALINDIITPDLVRAIELDLSFYSRRPSRVDHEKIFMNYVSMLENTDDFIYFKDLYHVFTGASQTLVNITNVKNHWSELIGKTDYEVFDREYADKYFLLEKQVFNGDVSVARDIQPYVTKEGVSGWVDNRKYPIKNSENQIIGLFGVARDITQQILTDSALKKSEEEYRNIYENAPVGFCHASCDGELLGCNPAFARMLGYHNETEVKRLKIKIPSDVYVDPADYKKLIFATNNTSQWLSLDEVEWKTKDETVIQVELFARRVTDSKTNVCFIEYAARDVSKRVFVEKQLLSLNHLYAAHAQSKEALFNCQDMLSTFNNMCQNIVELGKLKLAWVGVCENGRTISPIAAYGEGTDYLENLNITITSSESSSRGPTATAYREKRPIWCQDYENDPLTQPWKEIGKKYGFRASASIPFQMPGETIGLLNLYSDRANGFDEPIQNLFFEMVEDLVRALSRLDDQKKIQNYDRDLRRSQTLNRVANRLTQIGGWAIDLSTMELFWSEEIYSIHGLSPDEAITVEKALAFYPGKYQKIVTKAVNQCLRDGAPYELEAPIVTSLGEERWTRISGEAVRSDAGEIVSIHGAMQDITKIRESQASLKRLTQAVEQSPSSILITDDAAHIVYVNQTFVEQTGYEPEEVIGRNPRFLQSGKTLSNDYREMWAALEKGEAWRGEFFNRRKDGSEYIVSLIVSPVKDDEGRTINYLAIEDDITEKKHAQEQIVHLAHYDQLTELPNRVLLNDHFEFAINIAKRNKEKLSVMFLDLDNFKNINDGLGHSVGDQLLIEVSKRLRATMRSEDLVGRIGGDEFTIILPKTNAKGAAILAQKIIDALSRPFVLEHYKLSCTPSIGVAIYPDDGTDVETLSKHADAAMYKVKQASKNGYMFFTQEMQAGTKRNLELTQALKEAIEKSELYVQYQPQLRLKDNKVIGAEALIRWNNSHFGEVSPAEFIPIAEEAGLINDIGAWVLKQSISDLKRLSDFADEEFQLSVNLSVVQFKNQDLVAEVLSVLSQSNVAPSKLTLELTETVAMSEPEIAIRVMDEFHKHGIHVAIDDFGTGYSSLSYLKRFKVNKLKIDKSFIDEISLDGDDRAIVSAIVNLSKSLGYKTLAEGVEEKAQLEYLTDIGCDELQGYLFSKPVGLEPLIQLVQQSAGELVSQAESP